MAKNRKKPNKKNNKYIILIYAIIAIALAIIISAYFITQNKEKQENLAYTEFIRDVDEGKVEEIEMTVRKCNSKSEI